ncbi:MAG: ArsR family transcriptional regulator [Dehalococcoidia bacterium]|nr:MAG: ArsR family transcriptional regulator [Dehalococcoidia bacterium]
MNALFQFRSRPATSHHLAILRDGGIVSARLKAGKPKAEQIRKTGVGVESNST